VDLALAAEEADFWLAPGETAVLRLDLGAEEVEAELPQLPLSSDALAALELTPAWLVPHLALTLSHLDLNLQDRLAALLLDLEDVRALDELAFTIAATTPEELVEYDGHGMLDLLVANALGPYENEPYVPFAQLVEEVFDQGWYTTVSYSYDDGGGLQSWELPWQHYYWYVVHPKLDMELPLYFDPERYNLADPPTGVFWRDWFMFSAQDEGTWDYRSHWLQEEPHGVDRGEPLALDALGSITQCDVDPLVVVADASGAALMVEQDYGAGTILSTTLDLEAAWAAGVTDLAENATLYVQRRDTLDPDEATLILVDDEEGKEGVGESFQAILESEGLAVSVVDIAGELPELDGFEKIILAQGSSDRWLEALWAVVEDLNGFASSGGTLLHVVDPSPCATSVCLFPGGVDGAAGELAGDHFVGHPVLHESIADFESLWDLQEYSGLSGERALSEATSALDAIGWFTTQNMFDNVSEFSSTHSDYDGERSIWPQRIMHNHFGNCGEAQDMISAAFRSALIPALNVWSMEDHVWNEFYFLDEWHPYQVDWSDGPTRIDYGGVGSDGSYDGGKEVSAIMGYLGNGFMADEHVENYTDTIGVEVWVTDADGDPVDGAMVLVAVENYYSSTYLDQAAWVHTDQQGYAHLTLGDNRNFWIIVATEIGEQELSWPVSIADIQSGTYPSMFLKTEAGDPTIAAELAISGEPDFVVEHQFDRSMGLPQAEVVESEGATQFSGRVALEVQASLLDVPAAHSFLGWYNSLGYAWGGRLVHPLDEPGVVDAYLVDADNKAAFEAGEPFQALWAGEGISDALIELDISTDELELYLLVSNLGSLRHVHRGAIALDLAVSTDEGEDAGGCACSSSSSRGVPLLGLFALLGFVGIRRGQ